MNNFERILEFGPGIHHILASDAEQDPALKEVLARLGEASEQDRVTLFHETGSSPNQDLWMSPSHQWTRGEIESIQGHKSILINEEWPHR